MERKSKHSLTSFVVIYFILHAVPVTNSNCPTVLSEKCTCEITLPSRNLVVICTNITSVDVLLTTVRTLRHQSLEKFLLFNSNIGYLPSNLFFETRVREIEIYGTPISHFTEASESAFLGLENSLEELALRYDRLHENIDIGSLSQLSKLVSLDLSHNKLNFIDNSWFYTPPADLSQLYLKDNGLTGLGSNAFSKVFLLKLLDLSENQITIIENTMLPQPANNLEYLYLSYNQIEYLEDGFFNSMSSIKRVNIDHNYLTTLSEMVWSFLWKPDFGKLNFEKLDLLGNYINCNCTEMLWLTLYDVSFLNGVCADPDKLRGRKLTSLWPWDICENYTASDQINFVRTVL